MEKEQGREEAGRRDEEKKEKEEDERWRKRDGSVLKKGTIGECESVTLQKRPITIIIPSFWRSHAVC